jgi:hypothetical protein
MKLHGDTGATQRACVHAGARSSYEQKRGMLSKGLGTLRAVSSTAQKKGAWLLASPGDIPVIFHSAGLF